MGSTYGFTVPSDQGIVYSYRIGCMLVASVIFLWPLYNTDLMNYWKYKHLVVLVDNYVLRLVSTLMTVLETIQVKYRNFPEIRNPF